MSPRLIQRLIERFGPVSLEPRTGPDAKDPAQTGSQPEDVAVIQAGRGMSAATQSKPVPSPANNFNSPVPPLLPMAGADRCAVTLSPKERKYQEQNTVLEEKAFIRGAQIAWLEKTWPSWQKEWLVFERFLGTLRDADLELLRGSAYAITLQRIQRKRKSDLKGKGFSKELKTLAETLHRAPVSVLLRLRQVPAFLKDAEAELGRRGSTLALAVGAGE